MKKRLVAIMACLAFVLALSGCYPTGEFSDDTSSDDGILPDITDGSHFEYSEDYITVSFDYPEIPDEMASRIKLKDKLYDPDETYKLFFGDEAPISEYIYGEFKENASYTTLDGSELTVEGNGIYYENGKITQREDNPVSYMPAATLCTEYGRDLYSITGNEIDGFPLQEALDSAEELISNLGITNCGEPRIYSLSLDVYERMKTAESWIFNEEYPLTEDAEFYLFAFPQVFGDFELSDMRNLSIDDSTREYTTLVGSSLIIVGVCREGIFEFEATEVYEPDAEVLSQEPVEYDFSYAVSKFNTHINNTHFTKANFSIIDSAKVSYCPVKRDEVYTTEFVPVWSFEGRVVDEVFGEAVGHMLWDDLRYVVRSDTGSILEYTTMG